MAYENFIADCIAGFIAENVDIGNQDEIKAEIANYIAGLVDMNLDDLAERAKLSGGKEKQAVQMALAELKEIKKAAKKNKIDESKVLSLVLEVVEESR